MTTINPELGSETMRTCCNLIETHGTLGIVDLSSITPFREACLRKAIAQGVELGYLKEGPKPQRYGKGNRRKTYVRTKKPFPLEVEKIEEEPPVIVDWSAFKPRRDWAVVALFGPYEARA